MTPQQFRHMALGLPESIESAHLGIPDFRVRGKIFATLGNDNAFRCVVKFTLEQQEIFVRVDPAVFAPVDGSWGRKGWTYVYPRRAKAMLVHDALGTAWRNVAPKRLVATLDQRTAGKR